MSKRLPLIALALLGACAHTSEPTTLSWVVEAENAPRTDALTPEDIVAIQRVGDVELSPDGKTVAHTLRVPKTLDEAGRSLNQIWLVATDGRSKPRRLTHPEHSSWSPRWSPKGDRLAFLSKRPGDEHTQLYAIPVAGGEAEVLLESESSISRFAWSPDGKTIAYSTTRESEAETNERKAGRDWILNEAGGTKARLFIHDLASGESKELAATGGVHVLDFAWAPDGERLAIRSSKEATIDHSMMYSSLHVARVDGDALTPLAKTAGKLGAMAWSPDGKKLAFLGAADIHDSTAGIVFVVPGEGGEARALTAKLEATGTWLDWRDVDTVVFSANQSTTNTINTVPAAGGEVREAVSGGPICHDVSLVERAIACAGDTALHPPEVFAGKLGRKLERLTVSNPELLTRKFGEQEVVSWKAEDGLELAGILIKPVGYQEGQRYPLAVLPHGGPEGISLDGWTTWATYPAQLFASRGYVVFLPNYRGSAGRGTAFATADHQDLGGKEFTDVLAGIDHLVELGLVDPERVGMGGWSYGGYFSALAATQYSQRFKAAMVAAGITNWISFTGTTEIEHENSLVHWNLWPWDDMELAWARSPLAHAKGSTTATLIVHGLADTRVPLGQSYELYRALRHLGTTTELLTYPREGHGLGENVHSLHFINHFLDWFDTHVKSAG